MATKHAVWLMAFVLGWSMLHMGVQSACAQEATTPKAKADDSEKALTAFRLDFALSETEEGKKINTRHYSMNVVPGYTPSNEIKIGSRVPVEAKAGETQYIDIGTNKIGRASCRERV